MKKLLFFILISFIFTPKSYAQEPSDEATQQIIDECHRKNKSLYPTDVDNEESFIRYIKEYFSFYSETNSCLIDAIVDLSSQKDKVLLKNKAEKFYTALYKLNYILYSKNTINCQTGCYRTDSIPVPIQVEFELGQVLFDIENEDVYQNIQLNETISFAREETITQAKKYIISDDFLEFEQSLNESVIASKELYSLIITTKSPLIEIAERNVYDNVNRVLNLLQKQKEEKNQ